MYCQSLVACFGYPTVPSVQVLRNPANQTSVDGGGVPTPCSAVSTRGVNVFVPAVLELY